MADAKALMQAQAYFMLEKWDWQIAKHAHWDPTKRVGAVLRQVVDGSHDGQGIPLLDPKQDVLEDDEGWAAYELTGHCEPSLGAKI